MRKKEILLQLDKTQELKRMKATLQLIVKAQPASQSYNIYGLQAIRKTGTKCDFKLEKHGIDSNNIWDMVTQPS